MTWYYPTEFAAHNSQHYGYKQNVESWSNLCDVKDDMYIAKLVKTELIQTRPAAYRKKFSFPTTKFLQNFSSQLLSNHY